MKKAKRMRKIEKAIRQTYELAKSKSGRAITTELLGDEVVSIELNVRKNSTNLSLDIYNAVTGANLIDG